MSETILYERRGAIAILTLHRPEVHNAVDGAMVSRLEALCEQLELEAQIRLVVITGAGERTFCAGADLDYLAGLSSQSAAGVALSRRMRGIFERLAEGRVVIAALGGDVLGGGCELALACHLRVAAEDIQLSFRPAALGAFTGWGGGARLFHLVGRGVALRLLLGAETVDAREAFRLGLVERLVPAGQALAEAVAWAERIAASSPGSVRSFLELDRAVAHESPERVIEIETRLFGERWCSDDFQDHLRAWRERRGGGDR